TLGNNVAEQAIHELVYRYSLLLGPEQLISYRNASQCLLFCPQADSVAAQELCDKLSNVELEGRKATIQMLMIDAVFVTINRREQLTNVFERLEDLLHETLANQH